MPLSYVIVVDLSELSLEISYAKYTFGYQDDYQPLLHAD